MHLNEKFVLKCLLLGCLAVTRVYAEGAYWSQAMLSVEANDLALLK